MKEFVSFSLFVGTAILTYSLLQPLQGLWGRLAFFNRKRPREQFDPYELGKLQWPLFFGLSIAFGVFLAFLLFGERHPALSALGVAAGYFPRWLRSYLTQKRKNENEMKIRLLLFSLADVLEAQGGLTPALMLLAQGNDRVSRRLNFHLGVGRNGLEALKAVAEDFQSPRLKRVVERLEGAEEGLTTPEACLEEEVERMEQEFAMSIRERVGSAPMRILIPSLILLLPPILVLALYPPVTRILSVLSGEGMGW